MTTTEPRTPEAIEAAIEDNAGTMHDAWLDAFNLLGHLATNIHVNGTVYITTRDRVRLDAILDAGATAMALDDELHDQLAALQNEEDN